MTNVVEEQSEDERLKNEERRARYMHLGSTVLERLTALATEMSAAGWTENAALILCAAIDAQLMQDEISAAYEAVVGPMDEHTREHAWRANQLVAAVRAVMSRLPRSLEPDDDEYGGDAW